MFETITTFLVLQRSGNDEKSSNIFFLKECEKRVYQRVWSIIIMYMNILMFDVS